VNEKPAKKPARRPLPAELPREIEMIAPKQQVCPDCGGTLRPLGEDVSEVLEYVPARFVEAPPRGRAGSAHLC
jgi:transposase